MGRKVTSVSIDESLHERLKEDKHVNASGLFNEFLREYYATGSVDGLEFQLRKTKRELEDARDRVERLEQEYQELKKLQEDRQQDTDPKLEKKVDVLGSIPDEKLTADNPAVINHAADLNMRPAELAETILERA